MSRETHSKTKSTRAFNGGVPIPGNAQNAEKPNTRPEKKLSRETHSKTKSTRGSNGGVPIPGNAQNAKKPNTRPEKKRRGVHSIQPLMLASSLFQSISQTCPGGHVERQAWFLG
jgi:hypothetical protein